MCDCTPPLAGQLSSDQRRTSQSDGRGRCALPPADLPSSHQSDIASYGTGLAPLFMDFLMLVVRGSNLLICESSHKPHAGSVRIHCLHILVIPETNQLKEGKCVRGSILGAGQIQELLQISCFFFFWQICLAFCWHTCCALGATVLPPQPMRLELDSNLDYRAWVEPGFESGSENLG